METCLRDEATSSWTSVWTTTWVDGTKAMGLRTVTTTMSSSGLESPRRRPAMTARMVVGNRGRAWSGLHEARLQGRWMTSMDLGLWVKERRGK